MIRKNQDNLVDLSGLDLSGPDSPDGFVAPRVSPLPRMEHQDTTPVVERNIPRPSSSLQREEPGWQADPTENVYLNLTATNLRSSGSSHLGSNTQLAPSVISSLKATISSSSGDLEINPGPRKHVDDGAGVDGSLSQHSVVQSGDQQTRLAPSLPVSCTIPTVVSATTLPAHSYTDIMRTDAVSIIRGPGPADFNRDLDSVSDETGPFVESKPPFQGKHYKE